MANDYDDSSADRSSLPLSSGDGASGSFEEGYRWTCPICGKSRLNRSNGDEGEENAIAALRTHVMASDGAGHGPLNEYPAEFEREKLTNHVLRVEGSRTRGQAAE